MSDKLRLLTAPVFLFFLARYSEENIRDRKKAKFAFLGLSIASFFILLTIVLHILFVPVFHLLLGDAIAIVFLFLSFCFVKFNHLRLVGPSFIVGMFSTIFVQSIIADGWINSTETTHIFHLFQTLAMSLIGLIFLALFALRKRQILMTSLLGVALLILHLIAIYFNPMIEWSEAGYMILAVAIFELVFGAVAITLHYQLTQELIYISEEKQALAEEKLDERTIELKKSNEALELFVYSVSHDLREPLRMVGSFMDLLKRELKGENPRQERVDEFMNYALRGSVQMEKLLESLLIYSRITGNIEEKKEVDLNQIMELVTVNLNLLIKDSGAKVIWNNLPKVFAIKQQMVILFQNLISNAIKYSKENSIPKIEVLGSHKDGQAVIEVVDNGVGIEKQYHTKVFELFQRTPNPSYEAGSGMGLTICKKIIEEHEGSIKIDSTPNIGSTFMLELPSVAEQITLMEKLHAVLN